MDKTAIKNFSIWARKALIRSVADKCGLVGVREDGIQEPLPQSTRDMQFFDAGTGAPASISGDEIKKRKALVQAIHDKQRDSDYKTAYNFIVEQVAYTWFNRLIAIRFMEVNDYLPSRIRVLSSEQEGKLEPDILSTPFDAELDFTPQERDTVIQWKDRGQKEDMDALFRLLFVKQCDALHEILPNLFQEVDGHDYTELLLNISFTDRDGVVYHLVNDIPESNFDVSQEGQVEIIGWAYQYYNTEPKAAVFAKKEKYTKEEIPAATQLFTPDWIVRYMVENSLGRLWVEGHLNDSLKENWRYYLEEVEQEAEVQAQLVELRKEYAALNPEDIKLIDPCMGSGHILVYAFDVLMQIYESQGYTQRDAAQSILANNLFGLDIDDRAAQLAYFAVMMKARQYDRRILTRGIQPHVLAIQESNGIPNAHLEYFGAGLSELEKNTARVQMENLLETLRDAKEYGSILRVENCDWALLRRFVAGVDVVSQITLDSIGVEDTAEKLMRLVDVGQELAQKYDVVVTNPPYMAVSNAGAKVNDYVKKNFSDSKADLFAVFIERCGQMAKKNGYQAMITQHAWMFLSSFEKLRTKLLAVDIVNMAHLGARAFEEIGGEVVQTTSFVIRKSHIADYKGEYCRLIEPTSQQGKEDMFLAGENRYAADQSNFSKIPGSPVAYWASNAVFKWFSHTPIGECALLCQGLTTTDNEKYVRVWHEPLIDNIGFMLSPDEAKNSVKRWFPFNKGGSYRKWYGNNELVVNYENDGAAIKADVLRKYTYLSTPDFVVKNSKTYFNEGLTWSALSNDFSIRWFPQGAICADKGQGLFADEHTLFYSCGLLNSCVSRLFLRFVSPTLDFNCGYVRKIPYGKKPEQGEKATEIVRDSIQCSRLDWDSYETSWDFKRNPLVIGNSLSAAYAAWKQECEDRFQQLKQNEEELNRIFIDIYGLQDELTPDVADKDITVHRVFDNKDAVPESMKGSNYVRTMRDEIVSLISYAVGCMFGRYSLDVEGLAYAGGEWDASKYITFIPDEDNCIPVTDVEYFDDDIVGRFVEFLRTVYGEDTLEENLRFVADALGGKGTTSREIIRNYFLNDFIKDHIKTYQKRPIYWMFDSGKQNGFKALIYMHRYDENTIGRIRADYLFKMQRAYENELKRTQDTIDSSTNAREVAQAEKRKEKLTKQLKETRDYDQKIAHLALARISIDLDDGVKANYEKIQTAPDGKKLAILTPIK